jgi:hypothetical protein
MLKYINPELIYLNFLNKWITVDPEKIHFVEFAFPNIPDDCFGTFLIKDKNGNKGIALLSSKIIKEMNARKMLNGSDEFSPLHSKSFQRYQDKMMKRYIKNISKGKTVFLKSVCPDAPLCIAFGKEKQKIMKHFNGFKDFTYASSVTSIGRKTKNGFARLIKYERDGYEASAVLKSTYKEDSDNLLFEYLVGQYINKQCFIFPCFIETYEWYEYNTEEDWENMKNNTTLDKEILKSLVIGKVALQDYISLQGLLSCFENKKDLSSKRQCTEIESLIKLGCAKSKYLSILIQHIKYPSNIEMMMHYIPDFVKNDLLNVLYQVYMPLATLFDTFTHYDLHSGNLIIYEPDEDKYIDYKYVMKDGSLVKFKSRYMVKIIDYGRCFFDDKSNKEITGSSKSIYKTICENIEECNGGGKLNLPQTYCGEDQGFSNFDTSRNGIGYNINSSVSNMTHDLLLLYRVKKELKDELPDKRVDPLLQSIFDRLEYGDELQLEAEQIRTGKKIYEHGSEEKPTTGKLIDGIPDKINNVIDAHNALKTQVLKNKEANDALYETMTSLGELTIYESGKAMEFKPKIRGLA